VNAPPLTLYVHIPWCVRKCPYCDFNSHNTPSGGLPEQEYVTALLADLDQDLRDYAAALHGRRIVSVFFGGGTPSLFSARSIGAILDGARARLAFEPGAEITLETNPGTVEHDRFGDYRQAGVNRLSFGIQSFNDTHLARLGRIHSAAEARRAVELARAAGYDNFNLDLMYALPGQQPAQALDDLEQALALRPSHVSHYQLTLEPNTAFASNPPPLPDGDLAWDMQEACQQRLAAAGYVHYETSAYARPGCRSVHNMNYWQFGDYLGIGAGAHAKLTDAAAASVRRRWKIRAPRAYLAHAGTPRGLGDDAAISAAQLPFEFMLNALRLEDGFAHSLLAARTGLADTQTAAALAQAQARGWLHLSDGQVRPTDLGKRFLNDVIGLFLP
jgi:putative oxygen-independent coproporphyrinogen III oxidase